MFSWNFLFQPVFLGLQPIDQHHILGDSCTMGQCFFFFPECAVITSLTAQQDIYNCEGTGSVSPLKGTPVYDAAFSLSEPSGTEKSLKCIFLLFCLIFNENLVSAQIKLPLAHPLLSPTFISLLFACCFCHQWHTHIPHNAIAASTFTLRDPY